MRKSFSWCWARSGWFKNGREVCRWCMWFWLAGSARAFVGTRARRHGRAVAMGFAAEPCAPTLPGPGWGPRRAVGVRVLLPWRSVGAGVPLHGWPPCAAPLPSHVLAYWVWASGVEGSWGLMRVRPWGRVPVRGAWSRGRLAAGDPGPAAAPLFLFLFVRRKGRSSGEKKRKERVISEREKG